MVLTLAACSSPGNKNSARGSFEYAKLEEPAVIAIPDSLDKPRFSDHYKINDKINTQGPIGAKVDIRAPALALPLATGTRVEPDDNSATIWFDQVDDTTPLVDQISRAINDYFAEIKVQLSNSQTNEFSSDWLNKYRDTGFWFWQSQEVVESGKYKITLVPKPHGRSLMLTAELVDYKSVDSNKTINPIEKQRAEVALVNEIVAQVAYQYRVDLFERQQSIAIEDMVTKGQTDEGSDAIIVKLPFDSLWDNMPLFFDKYGFTQTDLNETKKLYYVDYVKPDASFWDSVWGDEIATLNIPDASYQFKLVKSGKDTAVMLLDEEGNPVPDSLIDENMSVLIEALSFR